MYKFQALLMKSLDQINWNLLELKWKILWVLVLKQSVQLVQMQHFVIIAVHQKRTGI